MAREKAKEKQQLLQALLVVNRMRDLAKVPVKHDNEEQHDQHKEQPSKALALKFGKQWMGISKKEGPQEVTSLIIEEPKSSVNTKSGDTRGSEEEVAEEPVWMILLKSFGQMIAGVLLVGLFSDPMVDAITLLGKEWGIGAFYVSFVITPFCSNASEIIASLVFASNKTQQSSSMTYSQLYGAATMNATLGLAIFYALIHFRQLAWTFSAETLAILLITWLVCLAGAFKRTFTVMWIFPNLALYPLSLVFVWTLEHFTNWT